MSVVSDDLSVRLVEHGASPSQLVDLADEQSPRTLPYVDLVRTPTPGRRPVVYESQGQPRAYLFDGRELQSDAPVGSWIRRVAFRGDADWVGVLRPGRLDVYPAVLDGSTPDRVPGLPDGPFLLPTLVHLPSSGAPGVRGKLLELLRRSVAQAKELGLEPTDALSLVGRALFWRFLIDRGLLEGLRPDAVCPGATSWPECLETRQNALQTFEWLDDTFNGGLLRFDAPPAGFPEEAYHRVVGNIAHAATADGQLALRLPDRWSDVNFAHVPVGLLSEVYEAFAHEEHRDRARAESIFYTPRHIAEFVVDEAIDAMRDVPGPRILDPATGAGVFLVAAFRALVGREWVRSGARPDRLAVRRILDHQLTGFDINDSALRLAELALYLTAIELDPEERPRPLKLLKFEALREHVLFLKPGGADEGSLVEVEDAFRGSYDAVIGNPPWTARASRSARGRWADASRDVVRRRLGDERAEALEFPDTNPDLPFVYRAMEWAKEGGFIGLVTHARWLFAQTRPAVRARRDLLECVRVTGVLNGTALRDTSVWPNVRHAFCLLFATNELPPPRSAFLFVSPQLDRVPDRVQDRLRIDWQDAREIEIEEVIARPWSLKARFRGTPFDESVLSDLQRRGVPFGDYVSSLGTKLKNGYTVGGAAGRPRPAGHLEGLPDLKGFSPGFVLDPASLAPFTRPTLHYPPTRDTFLGPLLLVHESMRADRRTPRAVLSIGDVAYDERFDGVSFAGVADGAAIASYLQLVVQSSLFVHALLLLDGQFGVEREVVHLATIKAVPVVPWSALDDAQRSAGRALSRRLAEGSPAPDLLLEIDRFVERLFHLSNVQHDTITDTLATSLPTAAAKQNAVRPPSREERDRFAEVCQGTLREVLHASGLTAFVRERTDLAGSQWVVLQIDRVPGASLPPGLAALDPRRFVDAADDAAASLVKVQVDERTLLVGLLDRHRYWTATRARLLAAALLSEPLADV